MANTTYPELRWLDGELAELERRSLRRGLRDRTGGQGAHIVLGGRPVVNFGSNDYLNLAADPRLAQAIAEAARREGVGSGASPLICGHAVPHVELEHALAEFEGTEAALVFPSGFAANSGTIAALAGPGDLVLADRKSHASLLDGCRLSRADFRVFPHNDPARLDTLLRRAAHARRRLVVTDTLFSMDGDLAELAELADVCRRHGAMLLADEAHATGVFGAQGRGVAEEAGVEDRVSARVGTLSKALGCAGGFVAGSQSLIDWLVNRARPYVFSTAMPAPVAAAARAALDVVRAEREPRRRLLDRAGALRGRLKAFGWDVGASASQIIPVVVGDPGRAVALAGKLLEQGLFVPAVRPPTVPEGESCLRISLTAGHDDAMIDRLLAAMGAPFSPSGPPSGSASGPAPPCSEGDPHPSRG